MPKGKSNRNKARMAEKNGGQDPRLDVAANSDDDSVFNDDVSVVSEASTNSHLRDEGYDQDEDSPSSAERIEDDISEALELATKKSAQVRTKALLKICQGFGKKYDTAFARSRTLTLTDVIDKALKRGKPEEQIAAANLLILLCVQIGESDEVWNSMKQVLTSIMLDPAEDARSKAAVAMTLGTSCFLLADVDEFHPILESLEKVFKQSYKGGAKIAPEVLTVHTAALSSWTLLMTMASPSQAYKVLESHVDNLSELLESPDVDLRIAAGEAIVILYELCLDNEDLEDAAYEAVESQLEKLKQLATDSHKYRSKKDRKEQKSSFRDILRFIEGEDDFSERIAINKRETLDINSWTMKKQYDAICKALASGMNHHLTKNPFLREIFQLGSPLPDELNEDATNKQSKQTRVRCNQQASKARKQTIAKHRDKRSAVV